MTSNGHAIVPHAGLGCACPAMPGVHAGLGRATALTGVVANDYYLLAASIGLVAIAVWGLTQQQGTLGKVVFGVTVGLFGLMAVAKLIEAL